MDNLDPEENRLYARAEDLHPLHWDRLALRDAGEAAMAAGALRDGHAFVLELLGRRLRVDPEARTVRPYPDNGAPVGYQRALVAVAYLGGAVDVPPAGRWVAFRELPGGEAFFRGPHSLATGRLERSFGAEPGRLTHRAAAFGARAAEGADAGADWWALPRVPLRVLLWGATAEFPASAVLLTDARAHMHLALDVLWALSNLAIQDLVGVDRE